MIALQRDGHWNSRQSAATSEIKEVLMQSVTAEAMTRTLVADAIAAGGSDNVTVVVARMVG